MATFDNPTGTPKEKPFNCPFCRSKKVYVHRTMNMKWAVGCEWCGSDGPLCNTEWDAIHKWNRNRVRDAVVTCTNTLTKMRQVFREHFRCTTNDIDSALVVGLDALK